MEVRFVAEFKSINRISPLVWELEHIVGKDKAHTLVQTPCKLMVESWLNSGLSRETESQRVLLVFDVEPNKAYRLHQCGESYGGEKNMSTSNVCMMRVIIAFVTMLICVSKEMRLFFIMEEVSLMEL